MASEEFKNSWESTVYSTIEKSQYPDEVFKKLAIDGISAWKLLLNLEPDSHILEIGAGTDSQIHNLENCSEHLHLIDTDSERLNFSKKRHSQQNNNSPILYFLCDANWRLPFADNSMDCIILSRPLRCLYRPGRLSLVKMPLGFTGNGQLLTHLLQESRRVLKDSGQLVAVWDNLLDPNKLTFKRLLSSEQSTLFGYQHLLKTAGFRQQQVHSYQQDNSHLQRLDPIKASKLGLVSGLAPKPANLKQKLKKSFQLSPTFAYIASPIEAPNTSILDKVLQKVSESLVPKLGAGEMEITHHEITRKEKLVISLVWNEQPLILKLPLNKTALWSENNNVEILNQLAKTSNQPQLFAKALCQDDVYKQSYFVETKLKGLPLASQLKRAGRTAYLEQVFNLLRQLATQGNQSALRQTSLVGSDYQRLVQTRIDWIFDANGDLDLKSKLEHYFQKYLHGIPVSLGMQHGDFSVSNIFTENSEISGLIDWETGEKEGVSILDAINYLDSVKRLFNPNMLINQSIPLQASGEWSIEEEKAFLKRCFELYDIDPASHSALVYLRWLRHISYLMKYWLRFNRKAQQRFIYDIAKQLPSG